MEKTPRHIQSILFVAGIIWTISSSTLAQETGMPSPPPADIVFSVENYPQVGQDVILRLKVTPSEDMHAEISCLLPEGIQPVREEGLMIHPYIDKFGFWQQRQSRYNEEIVLYIGPLTQGAAKEFLFRVIPTTPGKHTLIASVEAMAKWGLKEESLTIDIE